MESNLVMCPVYEEIKPKGEDLTCIDDYTLCEAYAIAKKMSASDAQGNEYEDISLQDNAENGVYHFTKCSAYGNAHH